MKKLAALCSLALTTSLWGSTNIITVAQKPEAPMVYSGSNARTKAGWQQRFTLGPGDVIDISMYRHPEYDRAGIVVGPDGRITYLEEQGLQAQGLTVDELRTRLDGALAAYYKYPRVTVVPEILRSKKIVVLGKVQQSGVYTLDRPLTILEAVAEAGGLEMGVAQLQTIELADLPRSFLIRHRQRLPVDFQKLIDQGDLSQNYLLEPDDFMFFPSVVGNGIYVLGSVNRAGEQGVAGQETVVGALTKAGGFTPNAYKEKVLVVRGGLETPQRFIIDAKAILAGRAKDFPLEPKDVVYVSDHPWSKVEDLADLAATAFIQTMVTSWTGANIGTMLNKPILPSLP